MGVKFERVKTHFRENKELYALGVLTFAAGVVLGTKISKKDSSAVDSLEVEGDIGILNNILTSGYKPTVNLNHTVISESPATRLSYLVKVGEKIYETQREAAEAMGVSENHLSAYLNGKKNHLNTEEMPVRLGVRT